MNANIYETPEVDSIPEPAFRELLALVGSETSVLQIGVPDPATAEIIESHLGSRIAERVESARAVAPAGARTFDCIVFAQPLEGLKDPGMELEAARALLSASGSVLAVAANGTHASTRLAALDRANASGAAASDPLGAFSRYGIQELFERNGYVVTNWERQTRSVDRQALGEAARAVPDAVLSWLLSDPEAGTYRFVVRAVASGAAGELRSAREQLHETEESLREHAAALAEARDRIAELEERGRDSEELSERVASLEKELADLSGDEAALRQLLLDKHDATVRQQDEMHATSARREAQAAAEIAGLRGELTAAHARIEWMQTRRIWRVGTRWWRLKDFLKA